MKPPRPWLTYGLIAANLAVFAWSIAMGLHAINPSAGDLYELGGNFGKDTLGGQPWRLATSMFLHAGLLHITMNMLGLWTGGRLIEALYGRGGMGAIYVVGGLLGSLASAMRGAAVSVGASGAIFALYGAFAGFLIRHRKKLEPGVAQAATRDMVFFFGANFVIALQVPGIDLAAHLGGAVGGLATGWAIEQLPRGWSMLRRGLVIGGLGAAVIGGAAFVVPGGKPAMPLVVEEFERAESKVVDRYNELATAVRQGSLTDTQFADAIDRELLPVWQAARNDLEQAGLDENFSSLRRYARKREEALVGIRDALRAHDPVALKQHLEAFRAAVDE